MPKYASMFERLVANTRLPDGQNPDTACWEWTGKTSHSKRSANRYPRINIRINGKHTALRAHRAMCAILEDRTLDSKEEPDHLCYNTLCINPDHLEVVNHLVNKERIRR